MSTIKVDKIQNTAGVDFSYGAFRNKIQNADFSIDMRNIGSAFTANSNTQYIVNRWLAQDSSDGTFTAQRIDSDPPPNGHFCLKITTTSADASLSAAQTAFIRQHIEGKNIIDLGFGTSYASTIALSFYVKSSLTGNFGGAINNSAEDRSYPFTYAISSANTWEKKEVIIAGDTSGTWLKNNMIGMRVVFGLGVGSTYSGTSGAWAGSHLLAPTSSVSVISTLSATWQIANVQLEKGNKSTPFELLPPDVNTRICKRYHQRFQGTTSGAGARIGGLSGNGSGCFYTLPVPMRAAPSDTTGGDSFKIRNSSDSDATITDIRAGQFYDRQDEYSVLRFDGSSMNSACTIRMQDDDDYLDLNAEL